MCSVRVRARSWVVSLMPFLRNLRLGGKYDIMCLMWTRLLQYFGKADVARGRVDPSLLWFAVGNPAMMVVPIFLLWSLVVGASSYFGIPGA